VLAVANETTNSEPTPGDGNVNDRLWCNAAGLVLRPLFFFARCDEIEMEDDAQTWKNKKGCDIGYALAAYSCK
jgi:hypothetical protein